MHCKRIKSVAGLREIRAVDKGVLVNTSAEGSVVHVPSCRIVGEATSSGGSVVAAGDWCWYDGMAGAVHGTPQPLVTCPECNPGLDDRTNALNESGAFMHAEICRMLDGLGYRTTVEHPVHAAPLVQDPSRRPRALGAGGRSMRSGHAAPAAAAEFQRVLAESQQTVLARQRVLDIVATIPVGRSTELVLPIEVKKANPGYVDWVFMNYGRGEVSMTATSVSAKDTGGLELFKIPGTDLGRPPLHIKKKKAGIPQAAMGAYDGAVPLTLNRSSKYDFQQRSLGEAAVQVVEGAFGLITSRIIHRVSTGIGYDTTQYYVPVVVTTANLYSCSYRPTDFEMATGLVSRASLKKEEFLIYECPAPLAAFPSQLAHPDEPEGMHLLTKWQVVITRARSFEKLLALIRQADFGTG